MPMLTQEQESKVRLVLNGKTHTVVMSTWEAVKESLSSFDFLHVLDTIAERSPVQDVKTEARKIANRLRQQWEEQVRQMQEEQEEVAVA